MKSLTITHPILRLFVKEELLLLLVALFWGTSYGLTKSALLYTSVLLFIAIRFLSTHLILLYVTLKDFKEGRNKDWPIALPTGFLLLGIFCCEVYGVSLTSAANAAFLISLSIIMTAGLEGFLSKQRMDKRLYLLALMSLVGVIALTHKEGLDITMNQGDWLILGAAFLRGLMVILTKALCQNKTITNLSLTSIQSLIVGLGALVLAFINLPIEQIQLPKDANFWMITLYLVLFCTLFAFFIQNYAVRRISATKVSLLMGSEPLFGALFAIIFLGEGFTWVQAIGGALIFISISYATQMKAQS